MIVRVLGVGQFDVADDHLTKLNQLDDEIGRAIESGDQEAFPRQLSALLEEVKARGSELPDDYLGPSDLVLPGPDATFDEVRELLSQSQEGLIPG